MKKTSILLVILIVILSLTVLTSCTEMFMGKSAYEIAVEHGFEGTVEEWLDSLKGKDGLDGSAASTGKSAYEIAIEQGFEGTVEEWLDSLKGKDGLDGSAASTGKDAYEIAVEHGFEGTVEEWLDSLKGKDGLDGSAVAAGKSAYEIAVEQGFEGTVEEWLDSLQGKDGTNGVDSDYLSVSYAANKGILCSVLVFCEFQKGGSTSTSAGSGIIMAHDKESGNAYIITNYHVVYDSGTNSISKNIQVFLYGMQYAQYAIDAVYVGGSLTYDVAVIKITNSELYQNSSASAVEISSQTPHAGDTAVAIGNPQGKGLAVTAGIIGVDSEYIDMTGADGVTPVRFRVMRVDTAVNNGNSGGGLFNSAGQLIGMVNAKIISNNVENIGYAIPLSIVVNAYNNILRNCDGENNIHIIKSLVGINIISKSSSACYNEETSQIEVVEEIEVQSIVETGAANGKLEAGDIIKSFTYKGTTVTVTRSFVIVDYSLNFVQNETLTLHILRNGEAMNVDIKLVNAEEIA